MKNNSHPLISVVVPVYNTEHYLEQCLSSLCSQTLQEIEIICIDDGSTDGSKSIIKEFCIRDPRVSLVSQENLGACEARKQGILLAKGRYIGFVDSDDYVDNKFFEFLYAVACRNHADVVISTGIFPFYDTGEILPQKFSHININSPYLSTVDRAKLFLSTGSVCNKLYSSEICKKVLPFYFSKENCAEDNTFTIPVLILAKNVALVTHPRYFYRQHNRSICHQTISLSILKNTYQMYCNVINVVKSFKLKCFDYHIYRNYILRRRNWDCFQLSEQLPCLADQLYFILQTADIGFQLSWCVRKIRSVWRNILSRRS